MGQRERDRTNTARGREKGWEGNKKEIVKEEKGGVRNTHLSSVGTPWENSRMGWGDLPIPRAGLTTVQAAQVMKRRRGGGGGRDCRISGIICPFACVSVCLSASLCLFVLPVSLSVSFFVCLSFVTRNGYSFECLCPGYSDNLTRHFDLRLV